MTGQPGIVPCLSQADGHAARAFREKAFGPGTAFALNDAGGAPMHAETASGDGVVRLGTGDLAKGSPGLSLVAEDVEAHHARAAAAGAEIVHPTEDTAFATTRSRARDPEGPGCSFGACQPQSEAPEW